MTFLLIERVEAGDILKRAEAEAAMEELLSGRLETPEIVRLLAGLNRRTVEVQELAGFAQVMRQHARRVFAEGEVRPANMVDTCGTGGDGSRRARGQAWQPRFEFTERFGGRAGSAGSADRPAVRKVRPRDPRDWNWISVRASR